VAKPAQPSLPPPHLIPFIPKSHPLPIPSAMSLRIVDEQSASSSTDGHPGVILASPTATHSPHALQPQQPAISVSSSSINSQNVASSSTAVAAIPTRPSLSSKSSSSPPRSSTEVDLAGKPSPQTTARWRNSLPAGTQQRGDVTPPGPQSGASANVVEPSFDENVLRALCDLDVSSVYSESDFSTRSTSSLSPFTSVWCSFVA
jgi:hypothetical protein